MTYVGSKFWELVRTQSYATTTEKGSQTLSHVTTKGTQVLPTYASAPLFLSTRKIRFIVESRILSNEAQLDIVLSCITQEVEPAEAEAQVPKAHGTKLIINNHSKLLHEASSFLCRKSIYK